MSERILFLSRWLTEKFPTWFSKTSVLCVCVCVCVCVWLLTNLGQKALKVFCLLSQQGVTHKQQDKSVHASEIQESLLSLSHRSVISHQEELDVLLLLDDRDSLENETEQSRLSNITCSLKHNNVRGVMKALPLIWSGCGRLAVQFRCSSWCWWRHTRRASWCSCHWQSSRRDRPHRLRTAARSGTSVPTFWSIPWTAIKPVSLFSASRQD